jgi:ABC-2 type transport system permease protein
MNIFLVALRKELLEQRRTHRLLAVSVVLIFFGILSPLSAKFTPELMKMLPTAPGMAKLLPVPTMMDAAKQYLKNLSQFGVLLAFLVTMGAVAQEKSRGTAAMMLVKPLPRATFLGAKFAALAITFSLGLVAAAVAGFYCTTLFFDAPNLSRWLALNVLVLVYIMVPVALTLLCSVLVKSQAAAGGLAVALVIVLALIATIPGFGEYMPGQLLGWAGGVIAGIPGSHWASLFVCLGIISAALIGAWYSFERQEL